MCKFNKKDVGIHEFKPLLHANTIKEQGNLIQKNYVVIKNVFLVIYYSFDINLMRLLNVNILLFLIKDLNTLN